ncbi:MAG: tRNA (adenosine(37)-N6)-threonylcarbamoyltransferase complex dimerization subunit type 1 TsaB [Desulfovibrionaceae bacterium]|nr:tRNA (adenosine(37)-N6)-threonylcarbamoyltransferase complex dimerization subunit type 1 TsaB [Desulfovibrionaceae bacterium]
MTCSASSNNPASGLTLVLNAAEDVLQIVLGSPGPGGPGPGGLELAASQELAVPGRTLGFLIPALDKALALLGALPADVDRIACVRGPGSFTGLRISLAAAMGLAAGGGQVLAGLDYLPLLAAGAAGPARAAGAETIWVLTCAGRGQIYMQGFSAPGAAALTPAAAADLEQAASILSRERSRALLVGSAIAKNRDFFTDLAAQNPLLAPLERDLDRPRPETLLCAAASAEYDAGPIAPLYLRASDAEINLPAIARARGLDPDAARAVLDRERGG